MRLWVDDCRPAPEGYHWAKSVNDAIYCIKWWERYGINIELISVDHDAGVFAKDGGDFIRILDWLEETGRNYPIRLHTMNVVGRENMRRIIRKNRWTEVL